MCGQNRCQLWHVDVINICIILPACCKGMHATLL